MKITDPMEMLAIEAHRAGGWGALAAEYGWSRAYISNIKRGKSPIPPKLLARLGLRRVVEVKYVPMEAE